MDTDWMKAPSTDQSICAMALLWPCRDREDYKKQDRTRALSEPMDEKSRAL
jgi:hypothetical protein